MSNPRGDGVVQFLGGNSLKRGRTMCCVGIRRRGYRFLWSSLGQMTCRRFPCKLSGLLTRIDVVGIGFRVIELFCVFDLGGYPNEMTKRKYILVSRTSKGLASSTALPDDDIPPSTKTRVPSEAMA